MTDEILQNQRQKLEKLIRQDNAINTEPCRVVSGGGRIAGFVAKVLSKEDYNHYNVAVVETGSAGTIPIVMGSSICAVNVAEPSLSQGTLAEGTFVIISRVGDKYVFSAQV